MKLGLTPLDADFQTFVDDFLGESDRAAVILGAAKLDILLGQVLRRALLPSPTSRDDLFDQDQPLSSFSAKIHFAHRLGLIDSQFAKCLHLVRRVRNDFAHETHTVKLDTGPHVDRIRELIAPFKRYPFFNTITESYFAQQPAPVGAFKNAVSMMAWQFLSMLRTVTPRDVSQAETILPRPLIEIPNQGAQSSNSTAPRGGA